MKGPDMNTNHELLPLLVRNREQLQTALTQRLQIAKPGAPRQEAGKAADILFGAVLAGMGQTAPASPQPSPTFLRRYAAEFGDGLAPILKDVLGGAAPGAAVARAIDGYWRAARPLLQ
jgi:hypothetical protein